MGFGMRFLVVGLGSMGKRRIRNLKALGHQDICGVDVRQDRCDFVSNSYAVRVYRDTVTAIKDFDPDAMIISTSPESHVDIAEFALTYGVPCFIEASVVDADGVKSLDLRGKQRGVLFFPSCTMRYFPGPRKLAELISEETIGRPLCVSYHTGQYLPDWHPWESIDDYYVSRRQTGGCREIVPFELTWLNEIFGNPVPLYCKRGKIGEFDADIDDFYHCVFQYPENMILTMTVEVLSRPIPSRELTIIGSRGEIRFSGDDNSVSVATIDNPEWRKFELDKGTVESGYVNPEEPYIDEMRDFVFAVTANNPDHFPNTLSADVEILRLLERLDRISAT